jgi:DNA-binding FadR family transcriptional regulator
MFAEVNKALITSITATSQLVAVESTIKSHFPIYKAIAKRKPQAARTAMLEHLIATKRQLPAVGRAYRTALDLEKYLPIPNRSRV